MIGLALWSANAYGPPMPTDLDALRAFFNAAVAAAPDAETADRRAMLREWLTNPAFRAAVSQLVWDANQADEA